MRIFSHMFLQKTGYTKLFGYFPTQDQMFLSENGVKLGYTTNVDLYDTTFFFFSFFYYYFFYL